MREDQSYKGHEEHKALRVPATFVPLVFFVVLFLSLQFGAGQPSVFAMRLIVVRLPEEANDVLDQLRHGADFEALATARSIDPTAAEGGYLGTLNPSALRPELRNALQGVAVGRFTAAVRIPSGYAILKLLRESETPAIPNPGPSRILAATAPGAVVYGSAVGGFSEAQAVVRRFPKADGWDLDLRAICEVRRQSVSTALHRLEKELDPRNPAAGPSGASALDLVQAPFAWAQLLAYTGDLNGAIERWRTAGQLARSMVPAAVPETQRALGIASFHKFEMDNDLYRAPANRCLFPPVGELSRLRNTGSGEKATAYFLDYLKQRPDDLEVKWLLNLAQMLLGRYPDGVPQEHRIPLTAFVSHDDVGRFIDVATEAGLKAFSMAGGAIVDDFGNRGLLDVVTSSMDACESIHYFRNNGDGTFSERTREAGLGDQLGGLNIIQADYDNDGCMDILTLRGGWEFPMRMSLLRNNCDGTFSDVTRRSGLGTTAISSQTAVWADIDNDGFLDLFVGREDGPNRLFHNKGNGSFEDISEASGVDSLGFTKGVVAADYDNDRYADLYVSNYDGHNLLYHNNHDRTFTEVGQRAGVQAPWRSFAAWFFDYDNDDWPDLLVNSYYQSVDEVVRTYLGRPHEAETMKLFRNLGNGTFRDVTADVGLDKVFMPMAANFGDVNNDGFLDMYLGMGNPSFASVLPHELLLNRDGKSFASITASSGTGELHKGHGIAFADLDRDGDEDIIAEIGGAVPSDRHALRLFENPGQKGDWLNVRLVGVRTNRFAVGARVKVTVESAADGRAATIRSIPRTVGSGGSFGANPMELHIGLGPTARIRKLEVWWPTSDTHQMFFDVGANQFIEVREFADHYTTLERRSVKLGGKGRQGG